MNGVKRYDPVNSDGTCGICVEDADYGAYVEYADYAALEAECDALRAQLPSQVGEAVAWHTDDHLADKSATTYDREVAERWRAKGWPVTPLHYTRVASQEPHKKEVNGLKRDLKKKEVCDGSGS